jgi:hypothetical protein
MLKITTPWTSHPTNIDPSAKWARFEVDGVFYTASAISGAGWPMTIREDCDRSWMWNRTIEWDNWTEAERLIRSR